MSYCAVYLNRIHREKNLPEKPEDPLILEKSIPYDAEFTFIDFVPSVLTYSSSAHHQVEYHRFSHLIDTANNWLDKNSHWNIINCETVRLSYRHNVTSMVSRWEQQINPVTPLWSPISRGEFETSLKAFRLWIRRKDKFDSDYYNNNNDDIMFNDKFRKLKHLDFIPKRLNENSFETIDQLLERVNGRLKQPDTLFWNIITLESLKIEANSEWFIDPEISLADESSRHLTILRLFYEQYKSGDDMNAIILEENDDYPYTVIGIEDFKPELLSAGSFFKRPEFEPFCSLTQRASRWLNSQYVDYFLNAQSIDIKIKSPSKLETRNCTNIEHGHYIQFLRIVYCKLLPRINNNDSETIIKRPKSTHEQQQQQQQQTTNQSSSSSSSDNNIIQLCSKVFVATKLDHPLDSMQQRIYNWLHHQDNNQQQNVCILGAETINVYGKDDDEKVLEKKTSDCFYGNRLGSLNTFTFKAIRLYYCQIPIIGDNDHDDNDFIDKDSRAKYYRCTGKTFQRKKSRNFTYSNSNSNNNNREKSLQRKNSKLKIIHSNSFRMNNVTIKQSSMNEKLDEKESNRIGFIKSLRRSKSHIQNHHSTSCNCM
ncbi:hypothetical protein HUG17_2514 [Dermatophagoides farinae]|uniref:Uncharacterized protein n=1 Tax=Dermatophagoides farinae TaxID=6954 RepID=A0A9D4SE89_DERFA|nr:uncharacterized protein LOC124500374 [Dermatophagoides farinae]KAH7638481.1 hypothetical protein HUG17_2514 [Dermatophagoides farinae]